MFGNGPHASQCVPFKNANSSFRDIAVAIELIMEFTAGMAFDTFCEDPRTLAAVERKLQIISEAAIRLGDEAERRCPGPAWREIRGIGNWLRHQYDRVELPVIWKTVREDLPALRESVLTALISDTAQPGEPRSSGL